MSLLLEENRKQVTGGSFVPAIVFNIIFGLRDHYKRKYDYSNCVSNYSSTGARRDIDLRDFRL
jgi:hypothetical protein